MIPEAREVRLSRKDRKVLEARCRSPVTLQRDLKRAWIVLLAADGRSTRSIAKDVGLKPRIVSLWRHRFADQGLEGLTDKPRPGKEPVYTKATDKRILRLLTSRRPKGSRGGQDPRSRGYSATLAPICLAVPAQPQDRSRGP
jgi:transposase